MYKNKKVFIVEDDDAIFDVMRIVLESERYTVVRFDDSKLFTEQIIDCNANLILMDIHYKHLHTEKLVEELRKNKQMMTLPIVISSADANLEKLSKKMNISAYLKKPFDMISLINIVKNNIK